MSASSAASASAASAASSAPDAALNAALVAAFPAPIEVDARLLEAAARAGRIKGFAEQIEAAARKAPARAESALREGLRAATALHSRERRFVSESLRALIRHDAVLCAEAGAADAPFEARWAAWLTWCDPTQREAALARARARLVVRGPVAALAFAGSLPERAAAALWGRWGVGAAAYLAASNQPAPVVLRANLPRGTRAALLTRLAEEGVAAAPTAWSPWGVVVDGRAPLTGLPSFKEGLFEVQDEGSQLLVSLVAPTAEASGPVVDFCAGAGGKSLALGALGGGALFAADVRPAALAELRRRAQRAGLAVTTARLDHEGPLPAELRAIRGQASRVLVDAPCTGSGVLRRHPEHRWRLDGAEGLSGLQRSILERAAPLVAVGGRLIYGTCSVLPAEDEAVVTRFLSDNPAFRLMPVAEVLGAERAAAMGAGEHLLVTPHEHGTDGFFGAVLERVR